MPPASRGPSNHRSLSGDPLHRAQTCLESASKRARRGTHGDAGEIIALLQQATAHLEEAVNGHASARAILQGAE